MWFDKLTMRVVAIAIPIINGAESRSRFDTTSLMVSLSNHAQPDESDSIVLTHHALVGHRNPSRDWA